MAASLPSSIFPAVSSLSSLPSSAPPPKPLLRPFSLSSSPPPPILRFPAVSNPRRNGFPRRTALFAVAALRKLSESEFVPIPVGTGGEIPSSPGIYGVYSQDGELQFIGLSRNVAASIAGHRKALPDLCGSVKVGLVDDPDRTVLTNAWKSWMEEHLAATGKVPPGNETGNNTWFRQSQRKPDLRLTPGRHVQLTVPLEELIDGLVKENKVVAFIKGSRYAPQCGFSQRVVGILESHGVDFECVNVLDEEYNYGLREKLKNYSNWPTFPQVFVHGELVGGCDILSSMEEKGDLVKLFEK